MKNERLKGIDWIVISIIMIGLVLRWTHVDEEAILMNIGTVAFGIIGFIRGIQRGYHKRFTVDLLRLLLPIVIILLAAGNLNGERNYSTMAIVMLLFAALSTRNSPLLKRQF